MDHLPVKFYLLDLKHHLEKNAVTCSDIKRESKCVSMSFSAGFDHADISIETSGELSPKFNCTVLWYNNTDISPQTYSLGLPDPAIEVIEVFVENIQTIIDLAKQPVIKSANKE